MAAEKPVFPKTTVALNVLVELILCSEVTAWFAMDYVLMNLLLKTLSLRKLSCYFVLVK